MSKNIMLSLGVLVLFSSLTACSFVKNMQENDSLLKTLQAKEEENESNLQQLKINLDELAQVDNSLKSNYQDLYNKYHAQSLELSSLKEFVAAASPLYKKIAAEQLIVTKLLESKPEKDGVQPNAELIDVAGKKMKNVAYYFTAKQENNKQYKITYAYDQKAGKWQEGNREEATGPADLATFNQDTQGQYLSLKDVFYSAQFDYNKDGKPDTVLVNVPPVGHLLFDGPKKMHEYVENLNEMKVYVAIVDIVSKSLLFNKLLEENIDYAFNQSKGISPKGIFPITVNNKNYIMVFFWKKPDDNGGKYFFRIYEPAFFNIVYSSESDDSYYCYEEIPMPVLKDLDGDKQNEMILFSSLKNTDARFTVLKISAKGKK